MKYGLVLEGGALRGLFSAGVMDIMMEHGIEFDGVVGVSAGAAFGCNYISRQPGRAIRYNKRFAKDWRYCSWRSWLKTGDLFGAEYAYHIVPTQYDIFDNETYDQNPTEFHVVCTDVETGKAFYKHCDFSGDRLFDYIRASASMPVVSKVVELDGNKLLDGGVADSIPLAYFEGLGFERNIVILTQPLGYQKKHNRLMPIMRMGLRKYPNMVRALDERHIMYNKQLEYVSLREQAGAALVIRPDAPIPIGHTSHDATQMRRVYDLGRAAGQRYLDRIKEFWAQRK